MVEHTPTPTLIEQFENGLWGLIVPDCHMTDEAAANAAFIVKALNNHDALVKALEEIEALGEKVDLKNEIGIRAGNIAHAALIGVRSRVGRTS